MALRPFEGAVSYEPQADLVGKRFRPRNNHPKTRGRVAIVLGVRSSQDTGCGVVLTYRYEDSPPSVHKSVSQRWFLENHALIELAAIPSSITETA